VKFDSDFHIHTELCGHAPGQTVAAILSRVDELGLNAIAITEHICAPHDMANIVTIREQVAKYHGPCRITIGAEVEADRNYSDGRLVLEKLNGLDYVIGSLHYLPGTDILPHCDPRRPLSTEEGFRLWQTTILGLVSNPNVDTLAHPGAMIANIMNEDFLSEKVLAVFAAAAEKSRINGIAWELNNLICEKLSPAQAEEYYKVIQLAVDAKVDLIFGSDSHKLKDIGQCDYVSTVLSRVIGTTRLKHRLSE
jgi:histidinol phosphatase-like PHP family hydrolase